MSSPPRQKRLHGQSLLGILIAIGIFGLLSNAIFTLVTSSYKLTGFTRSRITARHLAQDKIEFIRNLPYDEIGTQGGIPSGPLEQHELSNINGLNFITRVTVVYVDDSFDLNAPGDLLPTDYKRIRVEVSWDGLSGSNRNPVVMVTDITPKGVETTEGGGTLSILVFDANGEPVPQANVSIAASSISPAVDLDLQTQDNGRIILPGAPACINCYEIEVTKTGFSSEQTYSNTDVTNPDKPHSTVIEGDLTEVSFAIDNASEITIRTTSSREEGFAILPGTPLDIHGSKRIGTDDSGNDVYKYDEALTTNQSGEIDLELEWDTYYITPQQTSSLSISGSNPFPPYEIDPDTSETIIISLVPYNPHSLLLMFTSNSEVPVASVSASLSKVGFTETKYSGDDQSPDYGQVYFDDLSLETYDLIATASGYIDNQSIVELTSSRVINILLNQ